jgi:hypothetical protein
MEGTLCQKEHHPLTRDRGKVIIVEGLLITEGNGKDVN